MAAPTARHPTSDRLDAFSRGDLDDAEAATIEDHLTACAECQAALEATPSNDSLQALLREVARQSSDEARSLSGDDTRGFDAAPPGLATSWTVPDGYELIEPIGRGGMGVVYKARQLGLGRVVALKQMRRGLDADEQDLARFHAEASAVARLTHPNIVQIFDVGLREGLPFIAMEYLPDGSLAERLRDGPMRPAPAAALVEAVAGAIQAAHEAGVIHRDVKPANILLAFDGAPKLADFGLAKLLDAAPGSGLTRTGVLVGTPSYMAPEQADDHPGAVGPAADIYALGSVLYECLTGRPPFRAASPVETLDLVRHAEPAPPSRLQPHVPRDLQTICLTCLEKAPERRYPSARAFADDLDRFRRGEPIHARPAGTFERLTKWARRRPSQAALVGVTLVATVATIAGLMAHQSRLRVEIARTAGQAEVARQARSRADSNYQSARGVLQEVLSHFDAPRFTGIPRLSELRQAQLEDALEFYDAVLAQADADDDPVVQLDTARALRESATLQIHLGRLDPAEVNLRRSLALLDVLERAPTEQLAIARERLDVLNKLGVLLQQVERWEEAISAHREALELAVWLDRRGDRSDEPNDTSAWCLHLIASTLQLAGRPTEAESYYRRVLELRSRLAEDWPDLAEARVNLAETRVNLGLIEAQLGRPDAAEAEYRQAAEALSAAIEENSTNASEIAVSYGQLLVNWSNLLIHVLGRRDEAESLVDEGIVQLEAVLEVEPTWSDALDTAMKLHGTRAQILDSRGQHDESSRSWSRGLELASTDASRRLFRFGLALAAARSGDHARAVGSAADLVPPDDEHVTDAQAADLYNLACILALASAAAAEDEAIPREERAMLAEAYATRAVAWLRRITDTTFLRDPANLAHARVDPDLAPLAGREDFRRLLESIGAER